MAGLLGERKGERGAARRPEFTSQGIPHSSLCGNTTAHDAASVGLSQRSSAYASSSVARQRAVEAGSRLTLRQRQLPPRVPSPRHGSELRTPWLTPPVKR